jgi:hypothetical protein
MIILLRSKWSICWRQILLVFYVKLNVDKWVSSFDLGTSLNIWNSCAIHITAASYEWMTEIWRIRRYELLKWFIMISKLSIFVANTLYVRLWILFFFHFLFSIICSLQKIWKGINDITLVKGSVDSISKLLKNVSTEESSFQFIVSMFIYCFI